MVETSLHAQSVHAGMIGETQRAAVAGTSMVRAAESRLERSTIDVGRCAAEVEMHGVSRVDAAGVALSTAVTSHRQAGWCLGR